MDIDELINRLSEATGPDRELDRAILSWGIAGHREGSEDRPTAALALVTAAMKALRALQASTPTPSGAA